MSPKGDRGYDDWLAGTRAVVADAFLRSGSVVRATRFGPRGSAMAANGDQCTGCSNGAAGAGMKALNSIPEAIQKRI